MTYEQWQIGLEIQEDGVRALALVLRAGQLRQRRWWYLPLPPGCINNGRIAAPDALIAILTTWRKTLPWRYQIRLGFPAHRTLVRQLPLPTAALNEPEHERYIAAAAARQLGMTPDALALDYRPAADNRHFAVTAAQREDVAQLTACVTHAGLKLATVTPDASALCTLIPRLAAPLCGLVSEHAGKWIMASEHQWGWAEPTTGIAFEQACALLGAKPEDVAWCALPEGVTAPAGQIFDPWSLIDVAQPLPPAPARWLVTIALAAGEVAS